VLKYPILRKFRGNIKSTHNLFCRKFAAVCGKIATFCVAFSYLLNPRRRCTRLLAITRKNGCQRDVMMMRYPYIVTLCLGILCKLRSYMRCSLLWVISRLSGWKAWSVWSYDTWLHI